MTQTIDSSKVASLISQAEDLQTQLQELVDAMKEAAATSTAAGDIGHPPGTGSTPN